MLFRPLLAALSSGIRAQVVAYPATEPLALSELAALVRRRVPRTGAWLLAESFSGMVALTVLAEGHTGINGVIFVGAFAEPPRPMLLRLAPLASRSAALMRSTPSFLLRRFCLGEDARSEDLNLMREALAAVAPAVLAQRFGLVAQRHSFGKASLDVPSCYVRATEDRLVPKSCAAWFQKRFRQCRVEELAGPHFILQAKPRESASLIERICSR